MLGVAVPQTVGVITADTAAVEGGAAVEHLGLSGRTVGGNHQGRLLAVHGMHAAVVQRPAEVALPPAERTFA